MDHERSRDGYFRARRILDAIHWDQYEEDWRAPVRSLFESLLDDRAELGHDQLVAENSSHVAFQLAKATGLLDAAAELREPLRQLGDSPQLFADVYQAATWVLLGRWPNRYVARRLFFRGQRKPWRLYPTLYRDPIGIDAAIGRLTSYVRSLQRVRPSLTDAEGIAIAQHYSEENGVRTPLIDATRDPLVGLFFASLGGARGDRGVLFAIRDDDWHYYSCDGSNVMGALREITVRGVHRIEAQKGLFLSNPHPELFERFSSTLEFEQIDDLLFEDPSVNLTRDYLLRDEKSLVIPDVVSSDGNPLDFPLATAPPPELSGEEYLQLVRSWIADGRFQRARDRAWHTSAAHERVLALVCELHARMPALRLEGQGDAEWEFYFSNYESIQSLLRSVENVSECTREELKQGDVLDRLYHPPPRIKKRLYEAGAAVSEEYRLRTSVG